MLSWLCQQLCLSSRLGRHARVTCWAKRHYNQDGCSQIKLDLCSTQLAVFPGYHIENPYILKINPLPHIHTESPPLFFSLHNIYHRLTYYVFGLFILLMVSLPTRHTVCEVRDPVFCLRLSPWHLELCLANGSSSVHTGWWGMNSYLHLLIFIYSLLIF